MIRTTATKADPLLPLLNLLHHRDRFVRAAMLEQIIADGVQLTAPERLAIFDSPDWHTHYPDLDVAISAFYSPALDYPFTIPESAPRIWHICEDPQVFCQRPHRAQIEAALLVAGSAIVTLLVVALAVLPHVAVWQ